MIEYRLTITHPDGTVSRDVARGNTTRIAKAAVHGLTRSYERDGCRVRVEGGTRVPVKSADQLRDDQREADYIQDYPRSGGGVMDA